VQPRPQEFDALENLLRDFIAQRPQTITSPRELAERMAGKANLIKDVLFRTLAEDKDVQTELSAQYNAFKENLIHDITPNDFADIYAETIAYGMFAARLHDTTLDTFSRQEALELLPKSNPFLRSLFTYVAGYDLDDRIAWIIDDLARVFRACDVAKLMEGFGKLTGQRDPFLHFYETFLAAYNPAKRKARGVWYTPEPVVNFIVRAVDEVLQTEFGLADGLADTSKVVIDWETGEFNKKGKPVTIKKEVHRVQILDPATGTGTFLAEVIKQIAPRVQGIAPAMWSKYIEDDLIPRLHGFELLMASYAMCHMKLDMILTELGYKPAKAPPRLSVYLTNSLEEGEPANQTLPFTQWLSREAKGANTIKRDMPIMCVVGNPPYSGHSSNKGEWINGMMDVYKQSPELKKPAQAKWLSDDYVKFIRFSEHLIDRNGEGVLGFITNHSYLDNPTFLDMRQHLMQTFDRIYVMDLHGNSKKKEVTPEGKPDKNVFDIQQGVAVIIAVKKTLTSKTKKPATVYHSDLWGSRAAKYAALEKATTSTANFVDVTPEKAPWPFKASNWELRDIYYGFPSIPDWFSPNGRPAPGIVTTHDQFAISWTEEGARSKVERFLKTENETEARSLWRLCTQDQWNYDRAKTGLADEAWRELVKPITYRPFDVRYTVYDSNVAVHRRERASRHMLDDNIALLTTKANRDAQFAHASVCKGISEVIGLSPKTASNSMHLPLYLYPDEQDLDKTRRINLDSKLWRKLKKLAKHPEHGTPDEVQVFDYIYGVLHCPAYRETYAEFLKSDFPRIPWPTTPDEFWTVAGAGGQLRKLHLMEPAVIGDAPYPFTGEGDNVVDKTRFEGGKVWVNETQHFDNASEVSWDFYIGGYQPAQKWLKDRKGRALSFEDVKHYQRILKILSETDRIMQTITMDLPAPE
jgi:type I restriction-modification system DNA methylase subunit